MPPCYYSTTTVCSSFSDTAAVHLSFKNLSKNPFFNADHSLVILFGFVVIAEKMDQSVHQKHGSSFLERQGAVRGEKNVHEHKVGSHRADGWIGQARSSEISAPYDVQQGVSERRTTHI